MDIEEIRNEYRTEDEKMEIIADYLKNGGGSKKLRVRVKVAYTPTNIAEIIDTSATGVSGHAYAAPTGVSFEDEDGNVLSKEDVITALTDGSFELIDIDHLGDIVQRGSGDSITLSERRNSIVKLAYSASVANSSSAAEFVITGSFWGMEVNLPFIVTYDYNNNALLAIVGVISA